MISTEDEAVCPIIFVDAMKKCGLMMTLLGAFINGDSLYPKKCDDVGVMSFQLEVFEPGHVMFLSVAQMKM